MINEECYSVNVGLHITGMSVHRLRVAIVKDVSRNSRDVPLLHNDRIRLIRRCLFLSICLLPLHSPHLKVYSFILGTHGSSCCQKPLDLCPPSLTTWEKKERTREGKERKRQHRLHLEEMVRENPLVLKLVRFHDSHTLPISLTHTHTLTRTNTHT